MLVFQVLHQFHANLNPLITMFASNHIPFQHVMNIVNLLLNGKEHHIALLPQNLIEEYHIDQCHLNHSKVV